MSVEHLYTEHHDNVRKAVDWLDAQGEVAEIPGDCEHDRQFLALREELSGRTLRPSLLTPSHGRDIIPGSVATVWEWGGTKIRFYVLRASDDTNVEIIPDDDGSPLQLELTMTNHVYTSPEQFFQTSAAMMQKVFDRLRKQKIILNGHANIYSQDGTVEQTTHGIRIQPAKQLSKKLVVPGMEHIKVGDMTDVLLRGRGLRYVHNSASTDMNDTVAVCLTQPDIRLAGVGGTGTNYAIVLPDAHGGTPIIHNIETGDLSSIPLSTIEYFINTNSEYPGTHKLESITGGGNIGHKLNTIVGFLAAEGLLPVKINHPLSATHVSDILSGNPNSLIQALSGFDTRDRATWAVLREIARRLWERAVYTEGRLVSAIIAHYPESFPEKTIRIPVDGSKFWQTPWYSQTVQSTVSSFHPDRQIEFINASGAHGAGYAALREFARRQTQA